MYKSKVLVVEDDAAISNLIRTTLETQEYQYHTAQNGSGALMEVLIEDGADDPCLNFSIHHPISI